MRISSGLIAVVFAAAPALARAQDKADFTWEKSLAKGSQIGIHTIDGSVTVKGSAGDKVQVFGYKHGRNVDRIHAEVIQTSRGISVCVVRDDQDERCDEHGLESHSHSDRDNWRDRPSMDLEIVVPAGMDVAPHSVSGDVTVENIDARELSAHTVSGRVEMSHVRASGDLSGHTVSGRIRAQIDQVPDRGDLSFHTVSGGVALEMPKTLNVDLQVHTVSGSINSDYPITLNRGRWSRGSVQARIGSGGTDLQIHTVSGSVSLRQSAQ